MAQPSEVSRHESGSPQAYQEVETTSRSDLQMGADNSSASSTSGDPSRTSSGDSTSSSTLPESGCSLSPTGALVREGAEGNFIIDVERGEDPDDTAQSDPRTDPEELVSMDVDGQGNVGVPAAVGEVVEEAVEWAEGHEGTGAATMLDPSDMSWVSRKMRGYKSLIGPGHPALEDLQKLFRKPGWKVKGMREDEDITAIASNVKFTMHRIVFEKMRIVPPFNSFQRDVLSHLGVAPSQLHPNGWGFMKTFEHLCKRLGRTLSTELFLTIFELSWHGEFGTNMARKEQVSFKHQKGFPRKFFKAYSDSLGAAWKSQYFWVVPNVEAAASVCEILPSGDAGAPFFPFSWRAAHFEQKPGEYICAVSELDDEDRETLAMIQRLSSLLPQNSEGDIPCRPFCLYAGEELLTELGKALKMSGSAWLDLEKIAKGISTPIAAKKTTDAPSQSKPSGSRQQKSVSTGQGRSTAEGSRTPKRQRRIDHEFDCEFELESVGPQDYEAFKKDPLLVCGDICRSASQVFKDLKIEAASAQREKEAAQKERNAALQRLTELEPQIKALEEKDRQLEEARKAKDAAEKERKLADEERVKALKKNKELMSQNKNLQDQVARIKEDQAEAVAAEVKRIAELARGAALEQFNNAVSQMKAFNAARGAQFDGKIVNADHVVEDGEIVLPQKLDDEGKIVQKRAVIFGRSRK